MDRFEDMRCFVQVADQQSVTRAAAQLSLAPSAVSRRLKDLEARLGAQLLTRTTRRMSLTEAGQAYYARCQQILRDVEDAEAEVTAEARGLSGQLRLAAPLGFGLAHLAPILTDFMAEHGELVIDLDLSDRRVDLVGEGFDLAVRIGRLDDSSLIARRLTDVRVLVCAAPALLARHGTPATPEDLRALPALCYSGSARPDIWRYSTPEGTEGSVQMRQRLRVNSGEMAREAAIAGLGVAIAPSFIVHEALGDGRLRALLTDHLWPGVTVHVVYPETRHLSAKARAFIDFLRTRLGPRPPWEAALERLLAE
ncbi:MAG: LysR family transcriptional regulator [Pseudomonadota bacterium]